MPRHGAARLIVVARKMKGKGEEGRDNEAREEWGLFEVVLRWWSRGMRWT
jgi:hypothetical protein